MPIACEGNFPNILDRLKYLLVLVHYLTDFLLQSGSGNRDRKN
jgi:hypothetical protein